MLVTRQGDRYSARLAVHAVQEEGQDISKSTVPMDRFGHAAALTRGPGDFTWATDYQRQGKNLEKFPILRLYPKPEGYFSAGNSCCSY